MKKLKFKNMDRFGLEFLSIFIAVISAFTLNNWNEKRKAAHAEDKIIQEIYAGLEKDLEDIKLNVSAHKAGIDAADFISELVRGKDIPTDSFMIHYLNFTRDFISIQNTSGYETLKSRGLELIQSDSLRHHIVSLYEYHFKSLEKLEEEYYELQFQENYFREVNAILAPYFDFGDNPNSVAIQTPLKVTDEESNLVLSYLWKIKANRYFIIEFYKNVEEQVYRLQDEIETVLDL